MSKIKYVNGIDILQKRVDWTTYKNNYGVSLGRTKYSDYSDVSILNKNNIKNIYTQQSTLAKRNFSKKHYGMTLEEMKELSIEADNVQSFVQNTLSQTAVSAFSKLDKGSASKSVEEAILSAVEYKNVGSNKSAATKALQEAKRELTKILSIVVPEALGLKTGVRAPGQKKLDQIQKALYGLTMDKAVVTNIRNLKSIYSHLLILEKEITGKANSSTDPLTIEFLRSYNAELNKFEGSSSTTYKTKKGSIARSVGGTIGAAYGVLFEGLLVSEGQKIMKDIAYDIITTGSELQGGKKIKADLEFKINNKKAVAQAYTSPSIINIDSFEIQDSIAKASVKQNKNRESTVFKNTSIDEVFSDWAGLGKEYLAQRTFFYHAAQLAAFNGKTESEQENLMNTVNTYLTAHLALKYIGTEIDYLVFANGAVPVYMYLEELGNGRFLRMIPKSKYQVNSSGILSNGSAQIRN